MMRDGLLVMVAGWEDRFLPGLSRDLEDQRIRKVLMYWFDSYGARTKHNRDIVRSICNRKGVELVTHRLEIDNPPNNWKIIVGSIEDVVKNCRSVLIDISSMPRDIIWYVLWKIDHYLSETELEARYVYHSPTDYPKKGWLSRDPRSPRLVYKLSGVALPMCKTALLVTVGFDIQRVKRLIGWLEPAKLIVGIQAESQFERNDSVMNEYREMFRGEYDEDNCSIFDLDAYSADRGMSSIRSELDNLGRDYNIIMASLGPKLTAVSLYKIQRGDDTIGLAYTPANQYSENYSIGIGDRFDGDCK